MEPMNNGTENEEYIKAYDVPPMFPTYESLMKGAPGKKAK